MSEGSPQTPPAGDGDPLAWDPVPTQHPGTWTSATAKIASSGLSALRQPIRSQAAELLVPAIPGRTDAEALAEGMAHCAGPCTLSRWATALSDAASISLPGSQAVMDVLSHLLPRLGHRHHGVGTLLTVPLNESMRARRTPADDALRLWLAGLTGSSAATKSAKKLLDL